MGKKVRSPWSYLAYFTVAIGLGLLFAITRRFIFLGWGSLILITTISMLFIDIFRLSPNPKTTREKVIREIYIMIFISYIYLASVTQNALFPWLLAIVLFIFLLTAIVLYLVKKSRDKQQSINK